MNVFAYLRVSGKGQLEGDGFDRQRDSIRRFCDMKGWRVIRWFEERGVSGTNEMDARPALTELVSLLGPATADTFVVECADRLARDLMVSEFILMDVRKNGGKVFDAASQMDLTVSEDPTRVLIRQVLGAVAQWDKSMLVKKLKAARDRKSLQLGRRIEGSKPYEERSSGGAAMAEVIVMLRDKEGKTFRQIASQMMADGMPAPSGAHYWHRSTVQLIYARASRRVPFSDKPVAVRKDAAVADEVRHLLSQ